MFFKIISYLALLTIGITAVFLSYFLWINSYENFISALLQFYEATEKIEKFKTHFLPFHRFELIRYLLIIFTLGWGIAFYFFHKNNKKITEYCLEIMDNFRIIFKRIVENYQNFNRSKKLLFFFWFTFLTIIKSYFLFRFPIQIDEAFSYVFLVSKGFGTTLTYYPGPNNHIGYLLLSDFVQLLTNNSLLILRLPTFLISILTILLFFPFLKNKLGFYAAFLGMSLFSFSEFGLYYASQGRGYFLILFCTLSTFFTVFSAHKNAKLLFIISSVVGFYSIPIFLYPFTTILFIKLIFVLKEENKIQLLKSWIKTILTIIALVILCYSPVFMISGIDAVLGNSWVKPLYFSEFIRQLPSYLINIHNTFYTLDKFGVFGTIPTLFYLLFFSFLIFRKDGKKEHLKKENLKKLAFIFLTFSILPILFVTIQKVLPFARVWIYRSFFEYSGLAFGLVFLLKKVISKEKIIAFIVISICLIQSIFFINYWEKEIKNPTTVYNQFPKLMNKLKAQNIETIFVNQDTYNVLLRYEFLIKKEKIKVSVTDYNENKNYDLLVFSKKNSPIISFDVKKYQQFYQDDFVIVFLKSKL